MDSQKAQFRKNPATRRFDFQNSNYAVRRATCLNLDFVRGILKSLGSSANLKPGALDSLMWNCRAVALSETGLPRPHQPYCADSSSLAKGVYLVSQLELDGL
jgi:hypothetical protein